MMQTRNNGKFSRPISDYIKVAFIIAIIIGCLAIAADVFYVTPNLAENTVEYVAPQKVEAAETPEAHIVANIDIERAKIEADKEAVLNKLSECESSGRKELDGIAHLDSNDLGSYGPFEFQRKTIMAYVQKRDGKSISGVDAIIFALKSETARPLAKWIIFDTAAGVDTDWTNCSNKYGLQKKVDDIKRREAYLNQLTK